MEKVIKYKQENSAFQAQSISEEIDRLRESKDDMDELTYYQRLEALTIKQQLLLKSVKMGDDEDGGDDNYNNDGNDNEDDDEDMPQYNGSVEDIDWGYN